MVRPGSKRRLSWIIASAVILVAILIVVMLKNQDSLVYFYTPAEAIAKASTLQQQNIRIGGMIETGSVKWDAPSLSLNFALSDMKGAKIAVAHHGSPPDMFKEGQGVVVEGRLTNDGKNFTAHKLMVKHSEEYKKPDDHGTMDRALLEQSLFKNEKP